MLLSCSKPHVTSPCVRRQYRRCTAHTTLVAHHRRRAVQAHAGPPGQDEDWTPSSDSGSQQRETGGVEGGRASFEELKEQFRPFYLPGSFAVGTLTFGIYTAQLPGNFVFTEDPLGFIACAVVCGAIITSVAWVLFDFTEPTPGQRR